MPAFTASEMFGAATSSWEATPTPTPDHPVGTAAPFHRTSPMPGTNETRSVAVGILGLIAVVILLTQVRVRVAGELEA